MTKHAIIIIERPCPRCGRPFQTHSTTKLTARCPDCRKEVINERNRGKYVPAENSAVTVIYDPGEGAFSPNTSFNYEEHKQMLQFCSYTPGTILEISGKYWKVINRKGLQRLAPLITAERIYQYISDNPGVTLPQLSKALGARITENHLIMLESNGFYLSQDEEGLYAIERVDITPAPTKHKVYNSTVELLDSLSVE